MKPSDSLDTLSRRARRHNVPLTAMLEVTGRCHMDCVHCYLDIKNPPKNELTTDDFVDVLEQLKDEGTLFLTVTGGEVFLRPDLFDILEAASRLRFAWRLFTSGTRTTEEHVARIAALRPLGVEISIYALDSNTHDGITRRNGSLRKSLKTAIRLHRAGVPVVIKSPIIHDTDGGHLDLARAARRLGIGFKIDPSLMPRRDGGVEAANHRAPIETIADLYRARSVAPAPNLRPPPSPEDAPCAIARGVVRIGPTGDVFACSTFPIPAGNVRDKRFADIWHHSPVLEELRSITMGDLEGECAGCARQGYCGRCSAQALLEHGNFKGPSVNACDRAEAIERSVDVEPPPGARRIRDERLLGRRHFDSLVPLENLRRRAD